MQLNEVLAIIKAKMPADARAQVDRMEMAGLFGHGKEYEEGRYRHPTFADQPRLFIEAVDGFLHP